MCFATTQKNERARELAGFLTYTQTDDFIVFPFFHARKSFGQKRTTADILLVPATVYRLKGAFDCWKFFGFRGRCISK
jgi:hypothetical protein